MNIYKIIGPVWRMKGERYETSDRERAEARLAQIKRDVDPAARIVAIPATR